MDCPDRECPNPNSHLYLNRDTGLFICHRCGLTGNIVTFVSIIRKVSFKQASLLVEEGSDGGVADLLELKERIHEIGTNIQAIFDKQDLKNIIMPPPGSKRVGPKAYPTFLNKRRVPMWLAEEVGTLYCNKGRYSGRIIFPFTSNGHHSFVAYATHPTMPKKTLNPPGCDDHKMLYLYDTMQKWHHDIDLPRPESKGLIVVEGVMDALRLLTYNYRACALLKSHVSKEQAMLLSDTVHPYVIIMLDGDVTDSEYNKKLANLRYVDSKPIFIAKIPWKTVDPDDLTLDQVRVILQKSQENTNEFNSLHARIKTLKNE